MTTIKVGEQELEVDIQDSNVAKFLELFAPIVPVLLRMGKTEATIILNSLFSDDPYEGLAILRKNCTDEEWHDTVIKFVEEANAYNRKIVKDRDLAISLAGKALIGVFFALL